ncbi:MAG: 50S ribosomal protein L29 [Rikenellaceae bacterium]|nr:50S ribosomal protein L29 [Tidjanibacter sp.]MBQ3070911.1 50S ribosomal protein L29 [Tidjanibacter sp.]MBR1958589.1 50S ribosomal protein L29 [Tidjanibacter sp.]MBR2442696.1 50S ribosomal protein L29 [Rikenellaceae bacterium]MBR3682062.1 50S ribosomal protein L29 [Tidjanibacter sp.]
MKTAEIKEMAVADLVERLEAEQAKLASLKVNHAVSPVEDTTVIKKARRDIARMQTVLHQKTTKC